MKNSKNIKSTVFSTAWELFKSKVFSTFSECLKRAWQRVKLVAKMKVGIARFSFTKKDGTVRNAIGTLREGNFEYTYKGGSKKSNPQLVKYFDIERNAFRSFRLENLLSV